MVPHPSHSQSRIVGNMSLSTSSAQLISCHLIEKDLSGSLLWTWSYPVLSDQHRHVYMRKCKALQQNSIPAQSFKYFHYSDQWIYMLSSEVLSSDVLPKVKQAVVVLTGLELNPERYEALCSIFCKAYITTGQVQSILQLFLSVLVSGRCRTAENSTFFLNEFDNLNLFRTPKLSGIIRRFGLETILIYTALLLKKRILVYHYDIEVLIEFVLSLPAFLIHRNMWDSMYPWIDTYEEELLPFKDSRHHVIGCTDASVDNRTDLYDLYVNVPASEISVAPQARESMTMTKTHKDIALFMVQLTEKGGFTERDVMQEISRKTKDLIENLRTICNVMEDGRRAISVAQLKKKEFSNTLETFLLSLAHAEGFEVIQE